MIRNRPFIIYDLNAAHESGEARNFATVLDELGIKYESFEAQPIADRIKITGIDLNRLAALRALNKSLPEFIRVCYPKHDGPTSKDFLMCPTHGPAYRRHWECAECLRERILDLISECKSLRREIDANRKYIKAQGKRIDRHRRLFVDLLNCGTWYYSALEIDTYERGPDGEGWDGEILKRRIEDIFK